MRWGSTQTHFLQQKPKIVDHHEVFDICLALAPDLPSLRRILSWCKDSRFLRKAMPLPEEHRWRSYLRKYEKTDTVNPKDGVHEFCWNCNHASKGGSTQTLWWSIDFQEDPPNLTFFLASPNLEDEIHFKGGRFVTSQNSKFWNVINK